MENDMPLIRDQHGVGAPRLTSIVAHHTLIPQVPASAAAARRALPAPSFTILVTNQVDPYDKPLSAAAISALRAQPFAPVSDNFGGTKRKVAKLSISKAKME